MLWKASDRRRLHLFVFPAVVILGCFLLYKVRFKLITEADSPFAEPIRPMGHSKIILLPMFSLLTDPKWDNSNFGADRSKVEQRMLDFVESLEYGLVHPYVSEVHLMYNQDAMPGYIRKKIGNNPRLVFDRVNSTYMWAEVIEYIHEKFRNQLVLLTNGDVYPGEGLELLNYTKMNDKRLFYTPSRHGRKEKRCTPPPEFCDKMGTYPGAHDTYIFIPKEKFPSKGRELLKGIKLDTYGSENVLLYIYNNILKYKVLNPCHVIFMYHNHCSNLRHNDRVRIQPVSFVIAPSSNLE